MTARVTVHLPNRRPEDIVSGEEEVEYLVDLLKHHRRLQADVAVVRAAVAEQIEALQEVLAKLDAAMGGRT